MDSWDGKTYLQNEQNNNKVLLYQWWMNNIFFWNKIVTVVQ